MDKPTEPKNRAERIAKGLWWDRALTLVEGCTNVSPVCENCWAESATAMRAKQSNPKIKKRYGGLTNKKGKFNGNIRMQWDALKIPATVKIPTRFAVWNDLFHKDVTDDFIDQALTMMALCPWHTFIILTKRPKRMRGYMVNAESRIHSEVNDSAPPGPDERYWKQSGESMFTLKWNWPLPNVRLGVSVESPDYTWRIDELMKIEAGNHCVSYEPALEYVDFSSWLEFYYSGGQSLAWIIMGCESGPNRRPMDIEWARKTQKQCADARVTFFLKQMEVGGKVVGLPELDGKTYSEFPEVKK